MAMAQFRANGVPSKGLGGWRSPLTGFFPGRPVASGVNLQETGIGRSAADQFCEGSWK